jgi:hypothetical protein
MAQAYTPSYLGGRDWEDGGSMPAQAKVHKTPSLSMAWQLHTSVIPGTQETTNRIAVQASQGIK